MIVSLEPQAISFSPGSMTRICWAVSRAFRPYSRAGMLADLPWTVHLVAEAPVADVVRLFVPVSPPQVAPLGALSTLQYST